MSSSPVPLVEIKDAIVEINNGIPYSDKNLGPVLNLEDIDEWIELIPKTNVENVEDWEFRSQAKTFCLFYPNFIGDKLAMNTFLSGLGTPGTKFPWVISHNHGNTIVFVGYSKLREIRNPNFFTFQGHEPIYYKTKQYKQGQTCNWVKQADPSFCKDVKEFNSVYDMFKDCENKVDALKKCGKISDVSGAIQAVECIQEDKKKILDPYILTYKIWGWQIAAYQKLTHQPEERTIWWWWNDLPRLGKSMFCYWLAMQYPQYFLTIPDPGSKKDVMFLISQSIKAGWLGHCLILNLTMSFTGKEYLYSILECIKDSIVSNFKYSCSVTAKGPSHLVVFANFEPFPYDKDGTPLIDRNRLQVVKIPVFSDVIDPNPPRPQGRVTQIKDVDIRPEDQRVIDACNAAIKSGSTIKFVQKDDKGKSVPTNATKDATNIKVSVGPNNEPDVIMPQATLLPVVKPKVPYVPRDFTWKIYLNKQEGTLNTKGKPVEKKDVLLYSGFTVPDKGLIVCREEEYKNYKLFEDVSKTFFRDYYSKLPEIQRTHFEVILGNKPQKIFFDLDLNTKPENTLSEWHENHLITQIHTGIMKVEPKIKPKDIMIFNSHGSTKHSYHIVVDNFAVLGNLENKDFFNEVKTHVDKHLQGPMDDSVYKSVQQFRMYGSQKYDPITKTGCGRIKRLDRKSTWVNEEKEERIKELHILKASLVSYVASYKIILRNVESKDAYDGPTVEYSREEIEKIKVIVENVFPKTFKYASEYGNSLLFLRQVSSMCPLCKRQHDKQNVTFKVKYGTNKIYYSCLNAKNENTPTQIEIGCI